MDSAKKCWILSRLSGKKKKQIVRECDGYMFKQKLADDDDDGFFMHRLPLVKNNYVGL